MVFVLVLPASIVLSLLIHVCSSNVSRDNTANNSSPAIDNIRAYFTPMCGTHDDGLFVQIHTKNISRTYAGDVLLWQCKDADAIPLNCSDSNDDQSQQHLSRCEDATRVRQLKATGSVQCPAQGLAVLPAPHSCTAFYVCLDGGHSVRHCADGMHFDAERGGCNFAELAQCRRDWCPAQSGADELVTLPSNSSCGEFYVCLDHEPHPFRCLGELHWNQDLQDCDLPENVPCEITTTTTTTTTAAPPPPPPVCPGGQGIHQLPHPLDCAQFYVCTGDEVAHPMRCPDDLEFDPELGQCNRPENFPCVNRR